MARDVLVDLRHISKVFPPSTVALSDVSVSFAPGEIHAIVGENGAGKTTLMKVFYGLERRSAGEVFFKGAKIDFRTPRDAIATGIGMVHQETLLIPEYTVWQNIILGAEPVRSFGRIDAHEAREAVRSKIEEFRFNLDPDAVVGDISVAARQKVEILKLLYRDVSVLILDEPTAVLTPQEVPQLFSELENLRQKGRMIIFISHRLDEVLSISDRVTVMRRGHVVDTVTATDLTSEQLARMMVGREVLFSVQRQPQDPGSLVFRASHFRYVDADHRTRLDDVSVDVHEGEIVGVAGVEGNGQFELVNTVMGLTHVTSGTLEVQGKDITNSDILARRSLISFVPQDRGRTGASLAASVLENTIMTHHVLDERFNRGRGLVLDYRQGRTFTEEVQTRFNVSMGSPTDPFHSLSGGNQQKVILGRELLLNTPFVLMDQPTRGLDVGSIEYVHGLILELRKKMKAVLLVSADLDELLTLSDRVIVMYRGKIVANLATGATNREEIGYLMLGGKEAAHA